MTAVSRGEVGRDREFVCSSCNGNARWTRNDGKGESVCARGTLRIRVMGKSIRDQAGSKAIGRSVARTRVL